MPVKRQYQPALFNDLEAFLTINATGVHISEIESVNFGRVSGIPGNVIFALAGSDSRFHVGTGQYLYLSEWGGPRRVTLTEAIRGVLEEHVRPLNLDEIVSFVSKSLDHKLDRTAVSARLQSLDAVFNTEDRTWLAAKVDLVKSMMKILRQSRCTVCNQMMPRVSISFSKVGIATE